MYIKLNPINIALLLQETRNRKISKTHSLLNKMFLSLHISSLQWPVCPSTNFRSNYREMFGKKGVLKKFTEKQHSYQHRCFSVNFAKFVRTPFSQSICKWLLLEYFCSNKMTRSNNTQSSLDVDLSKLLKNLYKILKPGNTSIFY